MYKIPLANLNDTPRTNPILEALHSGFIDVTARKRLKEKSSRILNTHLSKEPAFYTGQFYIDKGQVKDTFISLNGWGKGIVTVNNFNIGRFWPVKSCFSFFPSSFFFLIFFINSFDSSFKIEK